MQNHRNMSRKQEIIEKLKNKYTLTVYNKDTLQAKLSFDLNRLNVFTYLGVGLILVIILVILLFAFTPLHIFLPKYTDSKMSRDIIENTIMIDSLEKELIMRDIYLQNIQNIMLGKQLENYESTQDTTVKYNNINFTKSKHDSILREQIAREELKNFSDINNKQTSNKKNLFSFHFFIPVKGMLVNKFNVNESHYGVDIVSKPNEAVLSTLKGTVIIATWSLQTGYIIQVQHENNLISIYKHNSRLLKKVGDHVSAGESIAIIGNSGEQTSGPHLHFELWHNGAPLNPEDYITF